MRSPTTKTATGRSDRSPRRSSARGHAVGSSALSALVAAVLCVGVAACGSKGKENASPGSAGATRTAAAVKLPKGATVSGFAKTITTSSIPAGQAVRGDGDADNPKDLDGNGDQDTTDEDDDSPTPDSYRFPDSDDRKTLAFGRAPSAAERRAIANTAQRYYAAGSAGDGATACSLIIPSLSRSLVEDYGHGSAAPSYLQAARSCSAVLHLLFGHFRSQLTEPIRVFSVRVEGHVAQAVIASRVMRASTIYLQRIGRYWMVRELYGSALP